MKLFLLQQQRYIEVPDSPNSGKAGGQGTVLPIDGESRFLVKLYHKSARTQEARERAEALISLGIQDPRILAPVDIVVDEANQFVGVLIPKAPGVSLFSITNLSERERAGITLTDSMRVAVCIAVVDLFDSIHSTYRLFVSDCHDGNFFIGGVGRKLPTAYAIDLEGYTFFARTADCKNRLFPSPVRGIPEYLPAELISAAPDKFQHTLASDLYGLALLIYRTLKGSSPYDFEFHGAGQRPSIEECVKRGLFVLDPREKLPRGAVPIDSGISWRELPRSVKDLFSEAFAGKDPGKRASASDWKLALEDLKTLPNRKRPALPKKPALGTAQAPPPKPAVVNVQVPPPQLPPRLPIHPALRKNAATRGESRVMVALRILAAAAFLAFAALWALKEETPTRAPDAGAEPKIQSGTNLKALKAKNFNQEDPDWKDSPPLWKGSLTK